MHMPPVPPSEKSHSRCSYVLLFLCFFSSRETAVSGALPSACGSVSLSLYYHICMGYYFFSVPYFIPTFTDEIFKILYFFSNTRNFALLDLLFTSSSSAPGRIGFLVITFPLETLPHTHTGNSGGQVQGFSFLRNAFFTIRSSREWKVMMQNLPPGCNRSINSSSAFFSTSSS